MTTHSSQNQDSAGINLWQERGFLWLLLAYVISMLGDMALTVVIPVTVYNHTGGSKAAVGFSLLFGTLPVVLFGLAGGVFADRWNRRRTMIVADIGRTFTILLLLGIPNAKHFGPRDLALFYTVAFIVASFSCFFSPARQGLIRGLLPREKLQQANGLMLSASQITLFVGPALGGLLITWFHPHAVFVFDAATFLVSAVLVGLIKNVIVPPGAKSARGVKGLWLDAREGLDYVWSSRVLRPALVLLTLVVIGGDLCNTLEFPFVRDLWPHGNGGQFALLLSLSGLAAILTSFATVGPIRSAPPARLLALGFAGMGAAMMVFSTSTSIFLGGAMMFLMAVANTFSNLGQMTLFMATAPEHLQGRVSATVSLVKKLSMALGMGLAIVLTAFFPHSAALRPIFGGVGLAYVLSGLLAWRLLGRLDPAAFEPPPVPEPVRSTAAV